MSHGPLRFLMVTTFYPPHNFGGDGLFVQRLSRELARRGHEVEVVHCADAYRLLAGRDPRESAPLDAGVTVHTLRSPWGFLSPLAAHQTGLPLFKSKQLRRIMEHGFDVINFHNISLMGGPGVLRLGRGLKLYTPHEYWLHCPTHILLRKNGLPCEQPACLTCALAHRRPPQWWRSTGLLRRSLDELDACIALSRYSIERHRRAGLRLPMVHIPSFAPLPGDAPLPALPIELRERPYFLYLGRLEALKGVQTVISLFRNRRDVRLVVAGEGSYASQLRALAAGSEAIVFTGQVQEPMVRALLRGAQALLVPSLSPEIFALVVLEALREGTPVIAREVGSLPEILDQSGGGLLFRNEIELSAAVDRLLADTALRDELGAKGLRAYREKWTPDAYLARFLSLINRLMAGEKIPRN